MISRAPLPEWLQEVRGRRALVAFYRSLACEAWPMLREPLFDRSPPARAPSGVAQRAPDRRPAPPGAALPSPWVNPGSAAALGPALVRAVPVGQAMSDHDHEWSAGFAAGFAATMLGTLLGTLATLLLVGRFG